MQVNHVLSAVLTQPWLISQQAAEGFMPQILKMLDRQASESKEEDESKVKEPAMRHGYISHAEEGTATAAVTAFKMASSFDEAPAGSISYTKLSGPMMKDDFCGYVGTRTLGAIIKEADSHENIVAHFMYSDSPGGTVAGTEDFAAIIKNTTKPFVAFVENMHSAAFWAGSGADVIILGGQTAGAGSIGTMLTINDFTGYYEKHGIKQHVIRAEGSEEKNEAYYQALAGNYKPIQKEALNPLNKVFQAAVKSNRADIKETALKGKVFYGQDAIDQGLADEIGTFEYAIQRTRELAAAQNSDDNKQKSNSNSNSETMFGKRFPKVAALAGKKADEISSEMIQEANAELEAAGIEGAALITEAEHAAFTASAAAEVKLTGENKDLTEANAKLTSDLEASQKEVKRLGALDGDKPSGSGKTGTELSEETIDTQAEIDALDHNKELANNPLFN